MNHVIEDLHQFRVMTRGNGESKMSTEPFAWEDMRFRTFLNHEGQLIYLASDFDWVKPTGVELIRFFPR